MHMVAVLRNVSHKHIGWTIPFILILGVVSFAIVSGIAMILLQAMFGLMVIFVVWGIIFKSLTS